MSAQVQLCVDRFGMIQVSTDLTQNNVNCSAVNARRPIHTTEARTVTNVQEEYTRIKTNNSRLD